MSAPVQPYLFSQIGLDSGALTMLGGIVHKFGDLGQYRGVVTDPGGGTTVFQLTVDEHQAAVPLNIDLAAVAGGSIAPQCQCPAGHGGQPHFVIGRSALLVLHVSGGPGGYSVHVAPAAEEPQRPVFDTRRLDGGDLFAATVLRPGRYTVLNTLAKSRKRSSLDVAIPQAGRSARRPDAPVQVVCARRGFEPPEIRLTAMQGCLFTCETPARIKIELDRPYDPPERPAPVPSARSGG
ncbi:MAG TPA: hypothetical protein VLW50_23250 [Streptosporangiaceae bacterium]|nr:hypothetical protein [Streptosporangiaceae bacterium]